MLRMRPWPRAIIPGSTRLAAFTTPRTFTSMVRHQSAPSTGHVGLRRGGDTAGTPDELHCLVELVGGASHDADGHAGFGQRVGDQAADAPSAARDERDRAR